MVARDEVGKSMRDAFDQAWISDDENETHPNIDTHSLFRMRSRHRKEKMNEICGQKEDLQFKIDELKMEMDKNRHSLSDAEFQKHLEKLDEYNDAIKELNSEQAKLGLDSDHIIANEESSKLITFGESEEDKKIQELQKKLGATETKISDDALVECIKKKDSEEKERNHTKDTPNEDIPDDQVKIYEINRNYALKHKDLILEMFKLKKTEKLKEFLFEHPELIHQGVLNWSLIKMVDFECTGKDSHVNYMVYPIAHLQSLVGLISQLKGDKKKLSQNYFAKFQSCDKHVLEAYSSQIKALLQHVKQTAKIRNEQLIKEDMERPKLGGKDPLDPNDVIQQLPEEMVQCFVKRDIKMLQEVIEKMDPVKAEKYMDMCIRSGLWNPDSTDKDVEQDNSDAEEACAKSLEIEDVSKD